MQPQEQGAGLRPGGAVYSDGTYELGERDGEPFCRAGDRLYRLSCHPYEPCLYIREGGRLAAVVRNAFDPAVVVRAFARGETVESATGKRYGARDFCALVALAASRGLEADIGYAERLMRAGHGEACARGRK